MKKNQIPSNVSHTYFGLMNGQVSNTSLGVALEFKLAWTSVKYYEYIIEVHFLVEFLVSLECMILVTFCYRMLHNDVTNERE